MTEEESTLVGRMATLAERLENAIDRLDAGADHFERIDQRDAAQDVEIGRIRAICEERGKAGGCPPEQTFGGMRKAGLVTGGGLLGMLLIVVILLILKSMGLTL